MKEVHVAVAVIYRQGQVLIARRPDSAHQGGLLEFPGGKVEPGESVQMALVREIDEETGLKVPPASLQPVIGIRHDYGDKRVFLDVWRTDAAEGEAHGREGQPIQWLAPDQLRDEDFPAANRPIIRALRLPCQLAITGGFDDVEQGVERLRQQLQHPPGMVVLRAPWLCAEDYQAFAAAAQEVCRKAGVTLLAHGSAGCLQGLAVDGLHLPWREAAGLDERPVPASCWLGISCHDEAQLAHAIELGADFVTLAPVRPTRTHPDVAAMGWARFQALTAAATVPVYALGGLGPDDVSQAREAGGQGIAGIGYWWR